MRDFLVIAAVATGAGIVAGGLAFLLVKVIEWAVTT